MARNLPDFERPIARNGNAYVYVHFSVHKSVYHRFIAIHRYFRTNCATLGRDKNLQ